MVSSRAASKLTKLYRAFVMISGKTNHCVNAVVKTIKNKVTDFSQVAISVGMLLGITRENESESWQIC
jgi:hypothetical protein